MSTTRLSADEIAFFRDANPVGFILFQRNIDTPDQVRALTDQLREVAGRDHLAILIDQEGGRVARLKPPHWPQTPPMGYFGALADKDEKLALAVLENNVQLIACRLRQLGISVNCLPLLDVRQDDADAIIGDRAFGYEPKRVSQMGAVVCRGLRKEGCLPIIKHIPGHGRSLVDSHLARPFVDASLDNLKAVDFAPFQDLNHETMAMTAHICFGALDPLDLVTFSKIAIDYIRREIGFKGLIISDDLSMGAIEGGYRERAERAKDAGVDLMLHCNGKMSEMQEIVAGAGNLTDKRFQFLEKELATLARQNVSPLSELEKQQRKLSDACAALGH